MTRFSDRVGITSPPKVQVADISAALRNSIWNVLCRVYEQLSYRGSVSIWPHVAKIVALFFTKTPVDDLPKDYASQEWVKRIYYKLPWYDVYNFMEFLVAIHGKEPNLLARCTSDKLRDKFNAVLSEELSGYRFIADVLSVVTSQTEVAAIEETIAKTESHGLDGAREHLRSALDLLGKRPTPDYRNSIKESISAVESVAKNITGTAGGGLDEALAILASKADIHGAQRKGFLSLYGYTSAADGIRHALMDEPNVGQAEALYMLVSCSAFVGYLITKADAAGLLIK